MSLLDLHSRTPRWASVSLNLIPVSKLKATSAYWPTDTAGPSARSQAISQALPTFNEVVDDMPLLPRARRRLLGDDDGDAAPAPSRRRLPASTMQKQSTQKTRKSRAISVVSDVSIASTAPAASTRSQNTPKTGKAKAKVKAKPIVLDESEEEEPEPTPAVTRSGRSGATSTLEGDASRSATRSTQSATIGRRKLLPADDDDGGLVSFGGKRRLVFVVRADGIV